MYKYEYKNLEDQGYKRAYISKKEHNEIFKYRKLSWKNRAEYYVHLEKETIQIEVYTSLLVKIMLFILFPVNLIVIGLENYKDVILDYKKFFNEKKYGYFSRDLVLKSDKKYYERLLSKLKVKE